MTALASFHTESIQPRDIGIHPALSALRTSPWFSAYPAQALSSLSANASLRSFGPRQQISVEGRWGGAAILVVKGCIRAVRRTEGTRELTLETFRPGELLVDGLVSANGMLAHDGLVAAETSLLMFLPREDFLHFLSAVPAAGLALLADFERRLGRVKSLATGLAMSDVESRLWRLFLNMARDDGQPAINGTVIPRSPTQQDLASRIGACRETVSRLVAELARREILVLNGRRLTLTARFFEMAQESGVA